MINELKKLILKTVKEDTKNSSDHKKVIKKIESTTQAKKLSNLSY